MEKVWFIFSVDERDLIPNLFPLGLYSCKEKAKMQIEKLPKNKSYQLIETRVNQLFTDVN